VPTALKNRTSGRASARGGRGTSPPPMGKSPILGAAMLQISNGELDLAGARYRYSPLQSRRCHHGWPCAELPSADVRIHGEYWRVSDPRRLDIRLLMDCPSSAIRRRPRD
jgi:hypothetical protein